MLEKIKENSSTLKNIQSLEQYNSPKNHAARLQQYAINDQIAKDRRRARRSEAQQNILHLESLYEQSGKNISKDEFKHQKNSIHQSRFAKLKNRFSNWFTKKEKPLELGRNHDKIKIKNVVVMLFLYFNALNFGYDLKYSTHSNVSENSRNVILEYTQNQGLAAITRSIGYVDKLGNKK